MNPMLTVAILALRKAGNYITKYYENFISFKKYNSNNFIDIDKIINMEKYIFIDIIKKYYPMHKILFKNDLKSFNKKNVVYWIISLLDGKLNFVLGIPCFSISVAISFNNFVNVAAVYNPISNEMFTAVRGNGARLNNYKLRINSISKLKLSIFGIGFYKVKNFNVYSNIFNKFVNLCFDFRKSGSPVLDFVSIASNRLNIFLGINFNLSNFLASELIVRESGGGVLYFKNCENTFFSKAFIAGNLILINKIIKKIRF